MKIFEKLLELYKNYDDNQSGIGIISKGYEIII